MPALVLTLVLALAACSGGSDPSRPAVLADPGSLLRVQVTTADVTAAVDPAPSFPDDVKAAVVAVLDRYLDLAVEAPLTSGKPADKEVGGVFTAPARARLATADRAALLDEGLDAAPELRKGQAKAALTALVLADGSIPVVVAHLTAELGNGVVAGGLRVSRTADLTLVRDGTAWRIDAYDVSVTRQVPGAAPTTTTAKKS